MMTMMMKITMATMTMAMTIEMRRCRYDEERRRQGLADNAGAPRGLSIDGMGDGIDDDYDR